MSQRRTAEQIVDAIASGARELFLERSPSAVSLREIATASHVNLGLIHRYVGSKDAVVTLVLDRHTAAARRLVERSDGDELMASVAEAAVERPGSGRLIAGLILDGIDVAGLKGQFPLIEHSKISNGELNVAMAYALALGWEVFGPTLLAAMNTDPTATTVSNSLANSMRAIQHESHPDKHDRARQAG